MGNIFDDGGDLSTYTIRPESAYADTQRGHFLDYANKVYRGGVEALDMLGRGAETYGADSLGSALRYGADKAKGTSFYKPDIQSYLGEDSAFKQYTGEALEAMTMSIGGAVGGAIGGGIVTGGNPFGAAAGSLSVMGTMFHGGSYSHGMEEAIKYGLSGEAAEDYANEYALWEVIPELIGDAALLIPFVGGTAKVGIKAIAAGLKSGKFTIGAVTDALANKVGTKALAHKWLGATGAGGGTEVLTEFGQNIARENAGMAKAETDFWHTFIVGALAQGAPGAVGTAYSIDQANKITEGLRAGLNSEVPEVRKYTIDQIYEGIAKADEGQASLFREYAYNREKQGLKVELGDNFNKVLSNVGTIREDAQVRQDAEVEYSGYQPNVPNAILEEESTGDVLKDEIGLAVKNKVEQSKVEQASTERDVEAEVTGTLAQREAIRRGSPGVTGALTGPPTRVEVVGDQERATEAYEPTEVPSGPLSQVASIQGQLPTGKDIPSTPQTALDRHHEYWAAPPEIKALYGRKDKEAIMDTTVEEVSKVIVGRDKADIADLLEKTDEPTKQAIVEGTQEVAKAKQGVVSAPTVADKVKAISSVKKAKKDLETVYDYSREEVGTYVSPEVAETEVTKPKQDIPLEAGVEVENVVATYPSGYHVVKVTKDRYVVLKKGEEVDAGAQYTSGAQKGGALTNAKKAAESGDLSTGTRVGQAGRKTKSQKVAGEKRTRDIGTQEKEDVTQWLIDNGYTTTQRREKLDKDGKVIKDQFEEIEILKDDVTNIALATLLQSGDELTKANLNKAIRAEKKAEEKGTEYAQSTKEGGATVYASVGEGIGTTSGITEATAGTEVKTFDEEGKEIGSGDEVVEEELGLTSTEEVRTAPTRPKVLRFHKLKSKKSGKYTGNWVSEWAGSNYEIKAERGKVSLYDGDNLIGTFDNHYEAAQSIGATIKDIAGGKSEQQDTVVASREAERELVGGRAEVDVERRRAKEASKKRGKVTVRRKKVAADDKLEDFSLEKGDRIDNRETRAVEDAQENIKGLEISSVVTKDMTQEEFLRLATSGQKRIDQIREEGFIERGDLTEYDEGDPSSFAFSEEEFNKSPNPYLVVDKDGKVRGHEGRHRATLSEGVLDTIPVTIIYEGTVTEELTPQFEQKGEDTLEDLGIVETPFVETKDHAEFKSVTNLLEALQLAKRKGNKATSALAKMILKVAGDTDLLKTIVTHDPGAITSYYRASTDTVTTNDRAMEGLLYGTFIHEAVHALTQGKIKSSVSIRERLDELISTSMDSLPDTSLEILTKASFDAKLINKHAVALKAEYGERAVVLAYAHANPHEFLAMAMNSNMVQEYMKSIEVEASKGGFGRMRSIWDMFIRGIQDALGLSPLSHTMLDEVLTETAGIIYEGKLTTPRLTAEEQRAIDESWEREWASFDKEVEEMDFETLELSPSKALSTAKAVGESTLDTFKDVVKRYLTPVSDRLMVIAKDLSYRLSYMDSTIARRVSEAIKVGNELEDQAKGNMNDEDLKRFSYLLKRATKNSIREANEIAKKNKVDMGPAQRILDTLSSEMVAVELISKKKGESVYWPRAVKDMDGLHDHYDKEGILPEIKKALKARGIEATEENIATIMADTLGKGGYPQLLGKPGASKARSMRNLTEEGAEFYFAPFDAFRMMAEDSINSIEQHRLVGKSSRLSLEIKATKLAKRIDKMKGEGLDVSKEVEDLKVIGEDLLEPTAISKGGIGAFLTKEGISGTEQREVRDMLFNRFNERGMSENMRLLKHGTLAMTLLNPTTAIKQLGDVGIAITERGLKEAVYGVKAALGDKAGKFNLYEMGIQQYILEQGERQDRTSQLLDKGFGISGFKLMDNFGKQVSYQASLKEVQEMSKEEFLSEYSDVKSIGNLGELYNNIAEGKVGDRGVQDFMTWRVSQIQPLFLSQMSEKMLTAGNARVFGMLLQYSLRRLGMLSTHFNKLKEEKGIFAASKYAIKVIAVLTAAEFSAECIAGLLTGKPCKDIDQQLEKTILGTILLDRYTLDKMGEGKIAEGILSLTGASAIESVDTIFKSSLTLFGDEGFDFKMLKNLPMGKIPYFLFTEEGAKEREKAWEKSGEYKHIFEGDDVTSVGKGDKEAILNQVKSNAMSGADMYAGGVTKMVEEYNA